MPKYPVAFSIVVVTAVVLVILEGARWVSWLLSEASADDKWHLKCNICAAYIGSAGILSTLAAIAYGR